MVFKSPRTLLFVVSVFVAAGLVAACGAHYQPIKGSAPTTTPDMPTPGVSSPEQPIPCVPPPVADTPLAPPTQTPVAYYYEPVTNAKGQTYYVQRRVPAPGVSGTTLSVLDGKLQVQTADGARMTVEKLTLLVGGVDPAEVAVADKLIEIRSGKDVKEGSFLQASAQKVTRTATDGSQLILEGNVKLLYVRKGKKIEVSTDLLSVNLSTGQVLSEMDAPKPTAERPPLPSKPMYRSGPPISAGPLP